MPALDADTLGRSIVHAGSADAWTPLFARLDAREPIVLGVFGASVAQNGGCLDQPYKRCMRYDGVHSTFMRWGEPHIRPFKGFAVRLLEYLNATYPHPKHQINNSALDATPAQNALPCLFSHLPTTLHVVILEFGSMAFHLQLRAVEGAARMLLSLRPRPLLIFLSMHEWCQRHKDQPRTLYEPGERLRGGFVYPDTPWARAEAETHRVCERYGQVCLSMHRALEPKVRQKLPGFSLSDVVGEDCLHPTHGVHGVEYIAEVLQHAFVHARGLYRYSDRGAKAAAAADAADAADAAASSSSSSISSISAIKSLPAPLHIENADIGERTARCYGFVKAADYRKTFGQSSMYRSLQPIEWTSVWCQHSGEYEHSPPPLANKTAAPGSRVDALAAFRYPTAIGEGASGGAACARPPRPAQCPRAGFGQSQKAKSVLRHFLSSPPRTWFWCYSSLALNPAHQKKSPGVLALVPGATLLFKVDSRMGLKQRDTATGAVVGGAVVGSAIPSGATAALTAAAPAAAGSATGMVRVSIEHLTSYENMGVATVRCAGGCRCAVQRIDAHRTDAHRNVSVFLQHSFELHGASQQCELQLQVQPETSSGGYKFKVRTITLSAGAGGGTGSPLSGLSEHKLLS
jgi:hypothetical protein